MNFTVETSDVADAEIEAAFLFLNAQNPHYAGRWLEGLNRLVVALDTFPSRHARVEGGTAQGREIRKMLYRNGRTVHQILFALLDTDGDGEAETVRILHVRHGARQPLGEQDPEDRP